MKEQLTQIDVPICHACESRNPSFFVIFTQDIDSRLRGNDGVKGIQQ